MREHIEMKQAPFKVVLVLVVAVVLQLQGAAAASEVSGLWVNGEPRKEVIALRLAELSGGKVIGTNIMTFPNNSLYAKDETGNVTGQADGSTIALQVNQNGTISTITGSVSNGHLKLSAGAYVFTLQRATQAQYEKARIAYVSFLKNSRRLHSYKNRYERDKKAVVNYEKSVAIHRARQSDIRTYYVNNIKAAERCIKALHKTIAEERIRHEGLSLPVECDGGEGGVDYFFSQIPKRISINKRNIEKQGKSLLSKLRTLNRDTTPIMRAAYETCLYMHGNHCEGYLPRGDVYKKSVNDVLTLMRVTKKSNKELTDIFIEDLAEARTKNAKLELLVKKIRLLH